MKKKNISKSKGFTLIELLVVISIISMFSSMILAGTMKARDMAVDSRVKSQLISIRTVARLVQNGDSFGVASAATRCDGPSGAGGLVDDPKMTVIYSANNWPAIGGIKSEPTCYSDASSNGAVIRTFSMWHALTPVQGVSKGWCIDSTGESKAYDSPTGPSTTYCP